LTVLDLSSGEERNLGAVTDVGSFLDPTHVELKVDSDHYQVLDIVTGEKAPSTPRESDWTRNDPAGRYELVGVWQGPFIGLSRVSLRDLATGSDVLVFDALGAGFSVGGELLVLTPAHDSTTNLFLVDIASRTAQFIATASLRPPDIDSDVRDIHVAADERWVVWTENFCWDDGATRIFDRSTGRIAEIEDVALPAADITPDGFIASGAAGATAFVDPESLEYTMVVTSDLRDITWSPDYRFASLGLQVGHGLGCGG
jgi:hypothetical protein